MKILITGASGFIGSFLCEEGLKRGMETWAGMREHSSRRWLQDERLNFAFLDMTRPEVLHEQLAAYKRKVGKWDVVIHAAGATKCLHKEDFDKANYECTKNLVTGLDALEMMPSQFLYVSSLSVLGPVREEMKDGDYEEMLSSDEPQPNTAYGRSKVKSEKWLHVPFTMYNVQFGDKRSAINEQATTNNEQATTNDKQTTINKQATLTHPLNYTIFRPTGCMDQGRRITT